MSKEYDLYLTNHRQNVQNGFLWIVSNVPELIRKLDLEDMEFQISSHDYSKFTDDEYEAYDRYFYGKEDDETYYIKQDFNKAWLLHIHRNPHHWQYWVLINDEPEEGTIIIDMPYNYIIEMICDWWAFSWSKDNLFEIFDWYNKHKNYIKLSNKTRSTVESILETIKNKLSTK